MSYNRPDQPLAGIRPGSRVTTIPLQVDALGGGRLRVSTPLARGWAWTARTAVELAEAIQSAFQEATIAGYARAHGEPYDLDNLTGQVPGDLLASGKPAPIRTPNGASVRSKKSYNPAAWEPQSDGRWLSPGGRLYRADSAAVQNVMRKRDNGNGPLTPTDNGG